jgi:hypothetical protein
MAKLSGGGISMNKNVSGKVRAGPPNTNLISARGVSQIGYATGSRMKEPGSFTTENSALRVKEGTAAQVPLGNQLATNVGGGGPGTGRTVMRTGSQSLHGSVAGPAPVQGRSVFAQFPPETTSRGSLVHKR